jgi:hypothetical protein
MSFVSEITGLTIDRMIFHVVGLDKEAPPIYLEEVKPITHGAFFLDRVKETLAGSQFKFQESSPTRTSLKRIIDTAARADTDADEIFSTESRHMAERFNNEINGNGAATPGVFLVLKLSSGHSNYFSLIKYEHEDVIKYDFKSKDGKQYVVLEEITRTFVKKKQAMQKSAFIIIDNGCEIFVIDRSESKGITRYFKNFLGVDRCFAPGELTDRFKKAVEDTVDEGVKKGLIDKAVKRTFRTALYNLAQSGGSFDPEKSAEALSAIVGADGQKQEVLDLFARKLHIHRIDGERFGYEKDAIAKPAKLRTRTNEGVIIEFNEDHTKRGIIFKDTYKGKPAIIVDISTGLDEDAFQISAQN